MRKIERMTQKHLLLHDTDVYLFGKEGKQRKKMKVLLEHLRNLQKDTKQIRPPLLFSHKCLDDLCCNVHQK